MNNNNSFSVSQKQEFNYCPLVWTVIFLIGIANCIGLIILIGKLFK